jgi:hypothetical protein
MILVLGYINLRTADVWVWILCGERNAASFRSSRIDILFVIGLALIVLRVMLPEVLGVRVMPIN